MNFTDIKYTKKDRIALVSLNRPRYKNAQSLRMLEELDNAFRLAADDPEVQVIVLRGEGDTFSAGHDIGTEENVADFESRPYGKRDAGRYGEMRMGAYEEDLFTRFREVPKPTIAAVQGYCIFNGFILAAAMDVVIASENAKFLPDLAAAWWEFGIRKAREIAYIPRFFSAQEAFELGFVSQVIPDGSLDTAVIEYAGEVAEKDPLGLWREKMAINQMRDQQGYNNFLRAAWAISQIGGDGRLMRGEVDRIDGRRRLSGVQAALDRFNA